jgi:hypothetical protein
MLHPVNSSSTQHRLANITEPFRFDAPKHVGMAGCIARNSAQDETTPFCAQIHSCLYVQVKQFLFSSARMSRAQLFKNAPRGIRELTSQVFEVRLAALNPVLFTF